MKRLLILVAFVSLLFIGADADCDGEIRAEKPLVGTIELVAKGGEWPDNITVYMFKNGPNYRYIMTNYCTNTSSGISQ